MSTDLLMTIAGVVVSFAFGTIPGLKPWFDKLDTVTKRAVLVGVLFAITLAIYGTACVGWLSFLMPEAQITCDEAGWWGLLRAFFASVFANQTTYTLFFKTPSNGADKIEKETKELAVDVH